jgi:hypothetical protein
VVEVVEESADIRFHYPGRALPKAFSNCHDRLLGPTMGSVAEATWEEIDFIDATQNIGRTALQYLIGNSGDTQGSGFTLALWYMHPSDQFRPVAFLLQALNHLADIRFEVSAVFGIRNPIATSRRFLVQAKKRRR